jgi:hypothetical protein
MEIDGGDRMPEASEQSYFDAYMEYNKALRNWLVGFGIGGPVLVLSNAEILRTVLRCGNKNVIFWSFSIGLFLQIVISFINKYVNWHSYNNFKSGEEHFLAGKIWIDFIFDVASIICFLKAAVLFGACVFG